MIDQDNASLADLLSEAHKATSVLRSSLPIRRESARSEQVQLRSYLADANFTLERLLVCLESIVVELQQPEARASEVFGNVGVVGAELPAQLTRMAFALEETQRYVRLRQLRRKPLIEKQMDRCDPNLEKLRACRDAIDAARL